MRVNLLSSALSTALIVLCGLAAGSLRALGATEFQVAATNVTMPATGMGSSQYTVTGIPISGNLIVSCQYSGPATEAKFPTCSYGPSELEQVTAGETVKGTVSFYPHGSAVPAHFAVPGSKHGNLPLGGLGLAGVLLVGLGLRRRARGWLALSLLAVGGLAGLAGLSACSGGGNGMTPGTYQYTITAGNGASVNNLLEAAKTNISVIVP